MLIADGLQLPVITGLLVEPGGKAGAAPFWHSGPICAKVGVILCETMISMVVTVAHCPASGVKV